MAHSTSFGITPLTRDETALCILNRIKKEGASPGITASNLVGKLLAALPELEPQYIEEIKTSHGNLGTYSVFFGVVRPIVEKLITRREQNEDMLLRLSNFIEEVCKCEDPETFSG